MVTRDCDALAAGSTNYLLLFIIEKTMLGEIRGFSAS